MSQYDTQSLYQYLSSTPEKALRGMLLDVEFTEVHFNLLMKVVRGCNEEQFCFLFEGKQFPRIRTNDKENKIKESFWAACEVCMLNRGLLFPLSKGSKVSKEAA